MRTPPHREAVGVTRYSPASPATSWLHLSTHLGPVDECRRAHIGNFPCPLWLLSPPRTPQPPPPKPLCPLPLPLKPFTVFVSVAGVVFCSWRFCSSSPRASFSLDPQLLLQLLPPGVACHLLALCCSSCRLCKVPPVSGAAPRRKGKWWQGRENPLGYQRGKTETLIHCWTE